MRQAQVDLGDRDGPASQKHIVRVALIALFALDADCAAIFRLNEHVESVLALALPPDLLRRRVAEHDTGRAYGQVFELLPIGGRSVPLCKIRHGASLSAQAGDVCDVAAQRGWLRDLAPVPGARA